MYTCIQGSRHFLVCHLSGEMCLWSKCLRNPTSRKGGFLGMQSQHKGSGLISRRWPESLSLRGGLARLVIIVCISASLGLARIVFRSSCHEKGTDRGAYTTEIYFLMVREARSLRSRCLQGQFPLRFLPLACIQPSSPCVLTWPSLCVCPHPDLLSS